MTATATKHACGRCGKQQPREKLTFSAHTRTYYCLDFKACDRRMARRGR